METKYNYSNSMKALEELKAKGYTKDYNVEFDEVANDAENFVIDYLYRYEGMSDPSDENSIYGLQNTITGKKGVFVTGNLSFVEDAMRDVIIALEIKGKQSHD